MTRTRFDAQLHLLNEELIIMGALCEEAIKSAKEALETGSAAAEGRVREADAEIDRKEHEVQTLCLKLLLMQQPVARDLRQVSAALKMITDMERIGDQAEDIAEIALYLDGRTSEEHVRIHEMADVALRMVSNAVDACVEADAELARAVISADDEMDALFIQAREGLVGMISSNPADGAFALDLLMIAKYFERIGDHATNIAEWVLFSVE